MEFSPQKRNHHKTSPIALLAAVWQNRGLLRSLIRREVAGRYRGSIIGLAWSFFHPLLMLSVYSFVFSVIFKVRWGGEADQTKAGFAIVLFVGMLIHGLFSECVNRAPSLILQNTNFVKKVVFPLEILPIVALGSAVFHMLVSLLVLLLAQLIFMHSFPWTIFLFPFIFVPLVLMSAGAAWFLAATGVFVRDIAQTTGILTMVLMFLSPVFYSVKSLPIEYQTIVQINPLTFFIEQSRAVLVFGSQPDWGGVAVFGLIGLVVAWAGFWWFQKTRKGFADVL